MPLIGADNVISILASYRLIWIGGRFGGHKTSLAYKMSEYYLKKGYRLVSNNASVWADDLKDVTLNSKGRLKAVVLMDEGGLEFKASRQIEMMASYARKMDVIYIIPSFWPPTRSARIVTIQPLYNLIGAGIPLVIYRWRVKLDAFEDKGFFYWLNPSEIYGIYSTSDPGDKGSKIVEWLLEKTNEYRSRFGYADNEISDLGGEPSEAERFSESAEAISEAADSMAAVSFRRRRR